MGGLVMRVCQICGARFRGEPSSCPLDGGRLLPMPDPLVGATIGGRYVVTKKIGAGGMGTVYKATQEVLGRSVAIKFLAPHLSADPANRTRFLREARAANRINHEHIIDITDFGDDNGLAYLVMEHLEGIPLNEEIRTGALAPGRALRIALQIAQALGRAHELDVIHRDIKPDNIFLLSGYDGDFVKILDFGLAHMQGELRVTASGMVFGTPEYIAPEQARGAKVGPSADLYSLGCVLYEMLTAELPFEGNTTDLILKHMREPPPAPSHAAPDVPPEVDALVLSLMQKEPEARPSSAFALADRIKEVLGGLEGGEPRATIPNAPLDAQPSYRPTIRPEDFWDERIELFRSACAAKYPKDPPPWLAEAINDLATRVSRIRKLRREMDQAAKKMTAHEGDLRDTRLQIGRALDELAVDHSRVERELDEARRRVQDLSRRQEDLRFQIAQLKGRLASLNAESEFDRGGLREQAIGLDGQLRDQVDELTRALQPVAEHLVGSLPPTEPT